jgi:hypothetical protein
MTPPAAPAEAPREAAGGAGTSTRGTVPAPAPAAGTLDGGGNGERLALVLAATAVALLPLLKPAGPANLAPVDGLILLAVVAAMLWAGSSRWKLRWPYAVPAALMMAGGALGALAGPVPLASVVALAQDVWLLVWCWTLVNLASSPARLRVLLATWAYAGVAWGVLLFVGLALGQRWLTGQEASEASRTALTTGDPSYGASYLFVSMMIMWATARPRRSALRFTGYLVLVAGILSTGSNSGMVSLVVGVTVACVMSVYARRGLVVATASIMGFLLVGLVLASTVSLGDLQRQAHSSRYAFVRDGLGRSGVSVAQRDMLLRESLALHREGSPLGAGPASTKTRLNGQRAQFVKESHDDYLAAIVERGPLGLLGLGLLLAGVCARAVGMSRQRLSAGFSTVLIRPHALVGAVAGTVVAMAVYELLHLRHLWALFALVAALGIWGRR